MQQKEKLSQYHKMTDEIHNDLYAIGTIIAPQHKLSSPARIGMILNMIGVEDTTEAFRASSSLTSKGSDVQSLPKAQPSAMDIWIYQSLNCFVRPKSYINQDQMSTMSLHYTLKVVCMKPIFVGFD